MTTKIKVKPIAIGAALGVTYLFIRSKTKSDSSIKPIHYLVFALIGAGTGFLISNMGEKKSNAAGEMVVKVGSKPANNTCWRKDASQICRPSDCGPGSYKNHGSCLSS